MLIEPFKDAQQSYTFLKRQKFNNYIGHEPNQVLITMYLDCDEEVIGIGWRWNNEERPDYLREVELNIPQLTEEVYNSSIHKLQLEFKKYQNDKQLKSVENDF
jgi:hypothetical protein